MLLEGAAFSESTNFLLLSHETPFHLVLGHTLLQYELPSVLINVLEVIIVAGVPYPLDV